MPLVDLAETGVAPEATDVLPLHVLERIVAIPYALDGDVLRVAIADPENVHAIDELRIATRHPLELSVASRDDILSEIRRMARASEAFGSSCGSASTVCCTRCSGSRSASPPASRPA
jgi:type IV pilus assembly protein PilB